jgi:hypothetical protein
MAQKLNPSNLCQRLLKEGGEQLSKAELLAILMETTLPIHQIKTFDLAYQLLDYKSGFFHLLEIIDNWRCHAQGFEKSNRGKSFCAQKNLARFDFSKPLAWQRQLSIISTQGKNTHV